MCMRVLFFWRSVYAEKAAAIFFQSREAPVGLSGVFIVGSFCVFDRENYLTLAASLIGVTSLIFNAKGNPIGQVLMVLFSLLYGIISYTFGLLRRDDHLSGHDHADGGAASKNRQTPCVCLFFPKAIFCKAAHQGVTAQVCPSAS